MHASRGLRVVCVCALTAPAACADDPAPRQEESDIIGGRVADDPALDAVGVLLRVTQASSSGNGAGGNGGKGGGGGAPALDPFCTGTLIAPDRVLTARHCIDDDPAARLRFGIGHDGWAPERVYEVASISSGTVVADDTQSKGDVGILTLTAPVEGIEPLPIAKLAPEHVGETFMVIGYGFSDPESTERGVRKHGPSTLVELVGGFLAKVGDDDDTIVCNGDSGSPLLREVGSVLTIFGVAATTSLTTRGCTNPATYQRFAATECPGGMADGDVACVGDAITRCDTGAAPGAELRSLVDCAALSPAKVCVGRSCVAPPSP